MKLCVKKFGGTSVGNIARIKHVATLIKNYLATTDEKIVVVVSAMAGETDKLVALSKSCTATPAPRELDVLLATGEQVTVALLSMTLIEMGVPAKSLLAQQARIATDECYTNANILKIDTIKVREVLDAGMVPVVAGFQGINDLGDVTTLGRGGSDITAVALASALNANKCFIYTDVEGVFSTDPRVSQKAKLLKEVTHEEMLEMASLGAKVLHPRCVYFAMRYKVPLVVLSTFKEGPGTSIVREEELMEKPLVTGITYRTDEAKLTIYELPKGIGALHQIFEVLGREGVFVDMITQTNISNGSYNVSFTVPDEASSKALTLLQAYTPEIGAAGAALERDIAKISVVGAGMKYHTGVAAKMFGVLAKEEIDVQMISTSEIKISVVVPRKYWEVAVRALHEAFVEDGEEITKES